MYFTTMSATRAAKYVSSAPVSAVSLRILPMRSPNFPTRSAKSASSAMSRAVGLMSSKRPMYSASSARKSAISLTSSSGSASRNACALSLMVAGSHLEYSPVL